MKIALLKGFSFGLTSGVITTLGLMVGLNASTHSKLVVIGGILSVAIADAFSDALGMHISVESEGKSSSKQIWPATISTFIAKFIVALTFVLPVLFWQNSTAIIIGCIWGVILLTWYSLFLAKRQNIPAYKVITEHVGIAVIVILITNFAGMMIDKVFK